MLELLPFEVTASRWVAVVFGIVLLLAGRRIFWLVVGVVGFLFAFDLARRVLGLDPAGLGLLLAILAGVLGVFLAIFLQKVAIGLAGFLVGGYFGLSLVGGGAQSFTASDAVIFLVAGVIAAILAIWLFQGALILLSSLAGAALVSQSLPVGEGAAMLAFLLLLVLGVAVQAGLGPGRKRRAAH